MKAHLPHLMLLIVLALILVTSLLFGACSSQPNTITNPPQSPVSIASPTQVSGNPSEQKGQSSTTIPQYGGTLRVITDPIASNIGWPVDISGQANGLTQVCLETLLRGDDQGKIVPWLAESYKVADDLKSITFHLRKGIKFHDGSDFNAEVTKWNLDNYINAKTEPYWASADILDEYTIRVNFTEWMSNLPLSFGDAGTMEAYMISKSAYDKNGLDWVKQNPVGTGPFKFAGFQQDVTLKYVKNPDYWKIDAQGNRLPYLDGIKYIFITDQMTQKMAIQTGEADMVGFFNDTKYATDYESIGLTVKVEAGGSMGLVLDTANVDSPWANQKVREAVEYAIDKEAIAKAFGYGYLQAPYQIPSSSSLAYDPNFTLARKYDLAKAKQLLAEAGYADGFKTSVIPMPMGFNKDILVTIQAYLDKAGIQVTLDTPDIGKWITYMGAQNSWPKGSVLFEATGIGLDAVGKLQFMFNNYGSNWLRTSELMQVYQAAITSPAVETGKIRMVTDLITRGALLIPTNDTVIGVAVEPYVMDAGFFERGDSRLWNIEGAWLNK
jgi:peptide/nickel transport system substrate-binding protein